ncbi:hypothetical protein L226DRAFT_561881 [Lentinus tigrinus ALCF2SS1-7]|uniref:uncharacterized protein n=1 Tax=Lentinus tigrinus ALCF2SS1-7 TaxID=1328758 RepID=UPI001165C9BF|nr:hypothetical protein L226DRAFT_561881 [Lentinus tigrinus ALCF2SS1-7]
MFMSVKGPRTRHGSGNNSCGPLWSGLVHLLVPNNGTVWLCRNHHRLRDPTPWPKALPRSHVHGRSAATVGRGSRIRRFLRMYEGLSGRIDGGSPSDVQVRPDGDRVLGQTFQLYLISVPRHLIASCSSVARLYMQKLSRHTPSMALSFGILRVMAALHHFESVW